MQSPRTTRQMKPLKRLAYPGPGPSILSTIKALPYELREKIFTELLESYDSGRKMLDIIIAVRGSRFEHEVYLELLQIFLQEDFLQAV